MSQQDAQRANPRQDQNSDILVAITDFVERNRQKIKYLADKKGGWEGWLQAELAYFLSHSTPYYASREQAVFQNPRQLIDIWCKSRTEFYSSTNPHPSQRDKRIGIELKCGGEYQDFFSSGVMDNFQVRMMRDINKIMAGMNNIEIGRAGARVYAIGVTAAFGDLGGFESVARSTGMRVRYWESLPRNGVDSVFVLWWYRDVPYVP